MLDINIVILIFAAILCIMIGAVIVLIWQRSKGGISQKNETDEYKKQQEENKKAELKAAQTLKIRDFMEFDKVEDDMIVQNDGNRYVMVIKCMGINYDLMSEPEMLGVEEGFANFLNTLKFPIQLYVQARSLDLTEGMRQYHDRLNELQTDCDKYVDAVNRAKATNTMLTSNQKQQMDYEIRKKRNLVDYGTDIVNYIEKMSLNRNILQRKYFIVVSYETNEMGMTNSFSKDEAKDVAYSELYTRCKTIQAAISSCGIETQLLNSEELAELLYIAYNKDDADIYEVKRALNNGFYRLYSTATSVMEKKKAALDEKMREDAIAEAELALKTAMDSVRNNTDVDISSLTEQEEYEDNVKKEAMQIILENQEQFDPNVLDKSLESLNNSMHQPLVSQAELDAAEEEALIENGVMPTENDTSLPEENSEEKISSIQDIDKLLNSNPIDNY